MLGWFRSMQTSDKIQTLIFIATLIAVILSLWFYFVGLKEAESQRNAEIKTTAIALQLDIIRLKTGVDSLDEFKIYYLDVSCDDQTIARRFTVPQMQIYPPNGAFYAFQKDIAKLNTTVAKGLYSFYYNLQQAENARQLGISVNTTSDSYFLAQDLTNMNKCLAAKQADELLGMLNQTIESL